MTIQNLIDRYKALLARDLDGVASATATNSEIVVFLNEALDHYADLVPVMKHKVTVLPTVALFDLDETSMSTVNARVITELFIDGVPLTFMAKSEFDKAFPRFAYQTAGIPSAWTKDLNTHCLFNLPLSAAAVAKTWTATVQVAPIPLTTANLALEPDLPERLHHQLVRLAVVKACEDLSLNSDQMTIVKNMLQQAEKAMSTYGNLQGAEQLDVIFPSATRTTLLNLR